jgi:hypothetical protein
MRRASTCLAVLGLALLALPGIASATPTVTFKALAVKIPGFPHTGNILGAGTDLETEYTVTGNEYAGGPPPITHINFYLPQGAVLHPSGFDTCTAATLEQFGPIKCPKAASAGPKGTVEGFVTFGSERVSETLELDSFFSPGGGISFFSKGASPVLIEILSKGHYINLNGAAGFGPEIEVEVPLVASVPGAPYASVSHIVGKFGAAVKSHGKTIYYGRVPKKCPAGGFPLKTEVTFAENGETSKPEVVTATYKAPCPRK